MAIYQYVSITSVYFHTIPQIFDDNGLWDGMHPRSLVARLRQPSHTGPNRCLPCTVVNLALVVLGAAVVGAISPATGLAVAGLGLALVLLRGYVVPGTPALTGRYLPEWVLHRFGKVPTAGPPPSGSPAEKLRELDVIADADDPELTARFRAEWIDTAGELAGDRGRLRRAAAETLSVFLREIAVKRLDAGGISLAVGDAWVGQWPSRTALVADLATERTLAGGAWDRLDRPERADLAARVRGVTDRCPVCETETTDTDETVSSCCQSTAVVAVSCPACDDRVAEFDPSPAAFAPGA